MVAVGAQFQPPGLFFGVEIAFMQAPLAVGEIGHLHQRADPRLGSEYSCARRIRHHDPGCIHATSSLSAGLPFAYEEMAPSSAKAKHRLELANGPGAAMPTCPCSARSGD